MTNKAAKEEQQVFEKLRKLAASDDDPRLLAALSAYEDARIDGLCPDGAWESALAKFSYRGE